jgi:hypothetical protein
MYTTTLLLALLPAVFAAPVITPRDAKLIPGKYIVKMKSDASKEDVEEAKKSFAKVDYEYDFAGFKGFAGEVPTDSVSTFEASDAVSASIWTQ